MKTAVYTIALNEERYAEAFMQSAKNADIIVVGDSGSTDRTAEIIRDNGGHVIPLHVKPWRFDVPRNTVLSVLPADINFCIALDLDERLCSDWRDQLERQWDVSKHNRLRFRYAHSVNADGTYGAVGMKDFAHSRDNYMWMHAVHEAPYYTGEGQEEILTLPNFLVEHHQDHTKSRGSYLPLLEVECNSKTHTPRHLFWLGREYTFTENWEKAQQWLNAFLECDNVWHVERGHAYRLLAKAYAHLKKPTDALMMHMASIKEAPKEREMWMDLAWYHHSRDQWPEAYGAVSQALRITHRPEHYLTMAEAWGYKIHELASLCAIKLGLMKIAEQQIRTAMRIAPDAQHLTRYLQVIQNEKPA